MNQLKAMLKAIHWRWLVPLLIFGGFTVPLVRLTFHNDEALAETFHHLYHDWAIAVHIAILAFPIGIAMLPRTEPGQILSPRRAAYSVWTLMLIFALVGNVLGNVAYTSQRTVGEVLDGHPTDASMIRQIIAGFGGVLLVAIEAAAGYLLEQSATWFLFGRHDSPADEPEVRVDQRQGALTGQRQSAVTQQRQPSLTGQRQRALTDGVNQRQKRRDRSVKVVKVPLSKPVDRAVNPSTRQGVNQALSNEVDTELSMEVDEPSTVVQIAGIPDHMGEELIDAVEAMAQHKSTRAAGEALGVSRTTISNRIAQARELAPDWVKSRLGE